MSASVNKWSYVGSNTIECRTRSGHFWMSQVKNPELVECSSIHRDCFGGAVSASEERDAVIRDAKRFLALRLSY